MDEKNLLKELSMLDIQSEAENEERVPIDMEEKVELPKAIVPNDHAIPVKCFCVHLPGFGPSSL